MNISSSQDLKKWLQRNYPLAAGLEQAPSSTSSNSDKKGLDGLAELAITNLSEGQIARNALYVLISDINSISSAVSIETIAQNTLLQSNALNTFLNICHTSDSYIARYHLLQLIKRFIADDSTSESARLIMLRALKLVTIPNSEGFEVASQYEIAGIFTDALQTELLRDIKHQSVKYQLELLDTLIESPHENFWPILISMSQSHPIKTIQKTALELIERNKETIMQMWETTNIDLLSSQKSKANALRTIFNSDLKSQQVIRAIFNYTKGTPAKNEKDPRLPYLEFALNDKNEAIRLAAARAILQSLPKLGEIWNIAVLTVADIAVNAKIAENSQDALSMLTEIEENCPEQAEIINKAKIQANESFISQHS